MTNYTKDQLALRGPYRVVNGRVTDIDIHDEVSNSDIEAAIKDTVTKRETIKVLSDLINDSDEQRLKSMRV